MTGRRVLATIGLAGLGLLVASEVSYRWWRYQMQRAVDRALVAWAELEAQG